MTMKTANLYEVTSQLHDLCVDLSFRLSNSLLQRALSKKVVSCLMDKRMYSSIVTASNSQNERKELQRQLLEAAFLTNDLHASERVVLLPDLDADTVLDFHKKHGAGMVDNSGKSHPW